MKIELNHDVGNHLVWTIFIMDIGNAVAIHDFVETTIYDIWLSLMWSLQKHLEFKIFEEEIKIDSDFIQNMLKNETENQHEHWKKNPHSSICS